MLAARVLLVGLICGVFAGIIAGVVLLGRGQSSPSAVEQLHLLDCAPPCWMGITPGQTSIGEAMTRFASVFGVQSLPDYPQGASATYRIEVGMSGSQGVLLVGLEFTSGISDGVTIGQNYDGDASAMPRVGDIVNVFGMPNCVAIYRPAFSGVSLFYRFPDGLMQVGVIGDRLTWAQPVSFLTLTRHPVAPVTCSEMARHPGFNPSRYR